MSILFRTPGAWGSVAQNRKTMVVMTGAARVLLSWVRGDFSHQFTCARLQAGALCSECELSLLSRASC